MIMKIEVFDKATGEKIGFDSVDRGTFDWYMNKVFAVDFIPENRADYVYGKFLVQDSELTEEGESKEIKKFKVSKYKLLCRNKSTDVEKQFDDEENSKWVEFPKGN